MENMAILEFLSRCNSIAARLSPHSVLRVSGYAQPELENLFIVNMQQETKSEMKQNCFIN